MSYFFKLRRDAAGLHISPHPNDLICLRRAFERLRELLHSGEHPIAREKGPGQHFAEEPVLKKDLSKLLGEFVFEEKSKQLDLFGESILRLDQTNDTFHIPLAFVGNLVFFLNDIRLLIAAELRLIQGWPSAESQSFTNEQDARARDFYLYRHLTDLQDQLLIEIITEDMQTVLGKGQNVKCSMSSLPSDMVTIDLGEGVSMEFRFIPQGEFLMGSPEGEFAQMQWERPQHKVRISQPFYMGVTPVTQLQYETLTWKNPSEFKGTAIPMHRVSWHEAMEFCKRLSYGTGKKARLPTEAEWEYACRAGTTTRFNFGDDQEELGEYAWHSQNNDGVQIHPVCQKKPNGWGLYDMHGNVHQWCWDWFDLYSAFIVTDPTGPPEGNCRILRGGCVHPSKCGSAYRDGLPPEFHFRNVGFRVVLEAG